MRRILAVAVLFSAVSLVLHSNEASAQGVTPAPGSAAVGNVTFVFGVDGNQRIFDDQASYGSSFVGWNELAGSGHAAAGVGAGYLSSESTIYALTFGNDHQLYLNQAQYGHSWGGWNLLPGVTGFNNWSPAITTSHSKKEVYAFAFDLPSENIKYATAVYGQSFGPWQYLGAAASAPAALTLPENDTQWVFYIQGDTGLTVANLLSSGKDLVELNQVGWFYNDQLTAVADSHHIYLFFRSEGQIWLTQSDSHSATTKWGPLQQIGVEPAPFQGVSASMLSNGVTMLYASDSSGRIWLNQGVGASFGSWVAVPGTF